MKTDSGGQLLRVYWGVVLIVVGVLFLVRNVGWIEFDFHMWKYWPVILILIGLGFVVKSLGASLKRNDH